MQNLQQWKVNNTTKLNKFVKLILIKNGQRVCEAGKAFKKSNKMNF